jgi:DNA-binding transcriptional MerR regulator
MSKSSQAFRTIREVAEWLDVAAHVLRFWESKFPQIKPVKRAGGRRYYRPADMELVGGIKVLLHDRGMTIRGVQKMIREEGVATIMALSPPVDLQDEDVVEGVDALEAESDNWSEAETEAGTEGAEEPSEDTAEDETDDAADAPDMTEELVPRAPTCLPASTPRQGTTNRPPRLPLPRTRAPNLRPSNRMGRTAMSKRSKPTPPRCPNFCTA